MEGVEVNVMGATELISRLEVFLNRLQSRLSLVDRLSAVMVAHELEMFASHGFGAWPPLAESTIKQKQAAGYPPDPLIRTGSLKSSLISPGSAKTIGAGDVIMSWGTGVGYAKYHQDGTARMPARPVLELTPRLEAEVYAATTEWIVECAQRAGLVSV